MPDYRLTTEDGDVVDTTTQEHDRAAVAWRSSRMFESAATDDGRQLVLEREQGGSWTRIEAPLGTSETT